MKFISWNVNGYRAVMKKGFMDFLSKNSPDIMAVQETKACPEQLKEDELSPHGYISFFSCAERKGYSGTALFVKKKPLKFYGGLGIKKFDCEGRIAAAEYENFHILNVYFPNGGMGPERIKYKLDFYEAFLSFIEDLRKKGKPVIFCGDVNTAHNEIDLARPRENENNTGFLRIERDWLDKLTGKGWIDAFRYLHPQKIEYTWWDYKTRARERNVGWRIDYFFLSPGCGKFLKKAGALAEVLGSDHCPLEMEADI